MLSVCDSNSCLAHWIACTCGPALDAICGCQILGSLRGYDIALETLKGTIGSDQMTVRKVICSLCSDKVVWMAEQVSQLNFQLINAHDILSEMSAIGEVNAKTMLQDIVQCLLNFAQNKWCTK